jgi:DNA-binding NarL/FixJ family response regulator
MRACDALNLSPSSLFPLGTSVSKTGAASHSGATGVIGRGVLVTRILIADDHEVVRVGLRAILEARPGWQIVAEVKNGRAAVAEAHACKPDIVIMEFSLPLMDGLEATRQILGRLPETEIMIFTTHNSDSLICGLLNAGAHAYVLKSDSNEELIAAVESLVNHRPFFNGYVSGLLLDAYLCAPRSQDRLPLSPREQVVVQLIAEGHRTKDMAAILSLSVKTIETHRAAAMRKFNVTSMAAVVRYAIRNKLVEP